MACLVSGKTSTVSEGALIYLADSLIRDRAILRVLADDAGNVTLTVTGAPATTLLGVYEIYPNTWLRITNVSYVVGLDCDKSYTTYLRTAAISLPKQARSL
jgi:hypothetical protein